MRELQYYSTNLFTVSTQGAQWYPTNKTKGMRVRALSRGGSKSEGEKKREERERAMPHLAGAAATPSFRVGFPRRSGPGSQASVQARAVGGRELRTAAEQTTFYELLGISSEGSLEEVRAAYRRMARKYHPDVSPPDAAAENTRRFIEVQEAYETLSDPSRRATYDRALARGVCRLAFSSASRRGAPVYQDEEDKSGWRRTWGYQIEELKRRSMRKDSEENLSWGARMRRRAESSSS